MPTALSIRIRQVRVTPYAFGAARDRGECVAFGIDWGWLFVGTFWFYIGAA
jgi:hypothetical protein